MFETENRLRKLRHPDMDREGIPKRGAVIVTSSPPTNIRGRRSSGGSKVVDLRRYASFVA
jgi:hypothetical protein